MVLTIILWLIMSLVVMTEYAEQCIQLKWHRKILVWFIFLISGPIFCAYTAITQLLDYILPDDQEDNDDGNFKH